MYHIAPSFKSILIGAVTEVLIKGNKVLIYSYNDTLNTQRLIFALKDKV